MDYPNFEYFRLTIVVDFCLYVSEFAYRWNRVYYQIIGVELKKKNNGTLGRLQVNQHQVLCHSIVNYT